MIDFSRREIGAKFPRGTVQPQRNPNPHFFLELTIELAPSDYPATIRGKPSASVSSSATISQQGLSRSYYNVGNIQKQISGGSHVSTHVFEILYVGKLIMFL